MKGKAASLAWGASAGWPETAAEVYGAYHADLKSQPPMDPFSGRPYGYARAGDSFVLSSRGPDGVAGTADDITWRPGRGWGRGAP